MLDYDMYNNYKKDMKGKDYDHSVFPISHFISQTLLLDGYTKWVIRFGI